MKFRGDTIGTKITPGQKVFLIVKGVRPVNAEISNQYTNGIWQSRAVHVAIESLEIWLLPSNYSDSFWSKFSIDRPIQPTVVVNHGPIKVYANPSSVLLSEKEFDKILSTNNGVSWPDSPGNNPELLTWKDWRPKLSKAIETEFTK